MTETFRCDDKDTLIAFLYHEIDPPLRDAVEAHVRTCAACTDELAALSGVRLGLAAWAPPQPELGFTMVSTRAADAAARPAATVVSAANGWTQVPIWAQAVAAVLVLAVAAGVANVQVRSGPDGVVLTTGWMSAPGVTHAATAVAAVAPGTENWKPALAALESQLRDEIRAARPAPAASMRAATVTGGDEGTITRVQVLLDESEGRQRRELALRLTQLNRDMDIQRRADLVRIEQGFGQIEGRTGAEIARQRQLVNYLMRVSAPQQ